MKKLEIELQFFSDFSIGTGQGLAGVLDNTVVKTLQGLPSIPGQTIKGVLRDNCRELVKILNLPKEGDPDSPVDLIFGNPFLPAAFRFPSAYLCNESMYTSIQDHLTQGEWHNQIEVNSGTAKKDHLFSRETASKELVFSFTITETIGEKAEPQDRDRALLIATLLFTKYIGGKRKRGRGRCRFSLREETWNGKNQDEWLDCLFA